MLEAEPRFGLDIPDEDAAAIETVGQFSRYIHGRLTAHDAPSVADERAVFERVCDEFEAQFRVDRRRINRESRFVKDLGLN